MRTNKITSRLLSYLCFVLIAAMALVTIGCGQQNNKDAVSAATASVETNTSQTVGSGENEFEFTVTDSEGTESRFTVKTDKDTVGDALLDAGLISGDEGEYGLYVKCVNGITADYEADGSYWAFYINGEYAMTGVDKTPIESGCSYAFKAEK